MTSFRQAGEMTKWWRALAAPVEDCGFILAPLLANLEISLPQLASVCQNAKQTQSYFYRDGVGLFKKIMFLGTFTAISPLIDQDPYLITNTQKSVRLS